MATLAAGGRITSDVVDEEIRRLRAGWRSMAGGESPDAVYLTRFGLDWKALRGSGTAIRR